MNQTFLVEIYFLFRLAQFTLLYMSHLIVSLVNRPTAISGRVHVAQPLAGLCATAGYEIASSTDTGSQIVTGGCVVHLNV
jgi:hypothetical protein